MKKLLSFLAAGALALGLIGCSGDLHDYEANEECIGLYLAGDVQKDKDNRGKLTFVDANTQTYKFTYDSTKHTYWGGAKGTINFKLVTDATTWTQDFGWKKDTPVFLSLNDDFLTLQARDAANSNPGNIKVENLINGKEYVITVNYDAPNKVAKVKIEGPSIDFPTLKLVDSDGNEYPLTREGTTYSYVWTPAEAGSKSVYVTNGYMFYGADGKVDTEKPDAEDYITVSYEANKEYIVKVETTYDKGADVTIEAGINCILNGFDGVFALFSDEKTWAGGSTAVKLDIKDTNTVYFEYANETNNPYAFLAVKKGSTWDVRYEADGTTTKVYELGNKIPTSTKELTNEKRGVIKIQPYHKYGVTVTIEGEDVFFKAEDKGEIAKEIPNLKDWGFKGNYFSSSWAAPSEGWAKFIETGTENEFSVEFVTTTENVEFGFLDTTGEWAAGGGFVIDALDKSFEGSVKSGGNSNINGLTIDATYILTITVKDSDGNATAKVSLKA